MMRGPARIRVMVSLLGLLLLMPTPASGRPGGSADAALAYGTFYGGSRQDYGRSVAVDGSGIYVLSFSYFEPPPATPGAFDTTWDSGDAVITKFSVDGRSRLWTTYLGGGGSECHQACSFAVDDRGAVYVTGSTTSADFPTTAGAFDTTFNSDQPNFTDAFVAKLSPDGSSLEYGTYLGGHYYDSGNAVEVDANGAAYVTGTTVSADFPTTPGAFQPTCADCPGDRIQGDAFVVKLDPSGSELVYSTFLGGDSYYSDGGGKVRVDATGAAYVLGGTSAPDFPTTPGAFDRTFNETWYAGEAFVAKLAPDGGSLLYSTYLGGGFDDSARDLRIDESGAVVVAGSTRSHDFPTTPGAFDTECDSCFYGAAFVTKLNPSGSGLVYSTYLEGRREDGASSLALDADGSAVVTGSTESVDFPTTPNAFDRTLNHGGVIRFDAFVTKLDPSGGALASSTFLGGTGDYWVCNGCGDDSGQSIALDADGAAVVTGTTTAHDFPTTPGAFDTIYNDDDPSRFSDVFLARIALDDDPPDPTTADLSASMTATPDPVTVGETLTYTVQVTNHGPDAATDAVLTDSLPDGLTLASATSTAGTCVGTDTVQCDLGSVPSQEDVTIAIRVTPEVATTITNTARVSAATADADGSNNTATATTTVAVEDPPEPPDTTITGGPSGETTSTVASFTFESSKTPATFECSLDASAFAACTSPASYDHVALGSHTFRVRALDHDGNLDPSPAERTWTVVPEPEPVNEAPTAEATVSCRRDVCTFESAGSRDPDGTIVTHRWAFSSGGTASTASARRTFTTSGTHTGTVTVTDDDGAQDSASVTVSCRARGRLVLCR